MRRMAAIACDDQEIRQQRRSVSEDDKMEYDTVVFSDSDDGNQPESDMKTKMVKVLEKTKISPQEVHSETAKRNKEGD